MARSESDSCVVAKLRADNVLSFAKLARRCGLAESTIRSAVKRLEARGVVTRSRTGQRERTVYNTTGRAVGKQIVRFDLVVLKD